MSFNRIFILGGGAIGSIYGALLSEKTDVSLVGNKAHVEKINKGGLKIVGDINRFFFPTAITEIKSIPGKALILLTTKAYDSVEAIRRIKKLLKKDTVILVLQNGIGNEEIVRQLVSKKGIVLRGLTTMAAEFLKPGRVRFWRGETIIESNSESRKIVSIFNQCGLKARLSDGINAEVWNKLVVNCVVNPLTALFHVRNHKVLGESLRAVRYSIVGECAQVAKAEGIALPQDLAVRVDKQVARYANFSSMYQDIAKGNRTEIDFLNGKIVELGRKHRIETPVNETLVSLIKFLEEG
ncbi:MAG TPA: 2-dehydropantoate 2-reductase [Candidatus Bathyarchaeia archaeon]|nr:2-dehydropantoate 2-reductase [Candidatus Bathyarchaeia archaeon]